MSELVKGGPENETDGYVNANQEPNKVNVIILANAIVYPGAVVIESLDAPVTGAAMATSGCPYHQAVRAQLDWVHYLHEFQEVHFLWLLNKSWIRELRQQPQYDAEHTQCQIDVNQYLVVPSYQKYLKVSIKKRTR